MSVFNLYFVTSFLASSLVAVTTAYGPNGARNGISIAGDSASSFASSASSNSAGNAVSASGLASTVAGFEQIGGQLANLQSGDMVVINNRRYLAVRPASDGQRNTMILIEASDDSYTLDAKVRHSVSQNLNAKSDGYSKTVASAVRDFSSSGYGSGRQSIVNDAPTVSTYSSPTTSMGTGRQSVIVEAASSSGFGDAAPNKPASVSSYSSASSSVPSLQPQLKTSVAARDQHSYSSVSANSRLSTPTANDAEGKWDYSESIPGVAGVNYPILAEVPATNFGCNGRHEGGYYADVETDCQAYHVCALGKKFSFLCANGTLFNQKTFVCEWWFNVDCASSPQFYELNLQIGSTTARTVAASVAQASVIPPISPNVPKPSYGVPSIQQSFASIIPQQASQAFEVKPAVISQPMLQPVTIEQSIKPSYGVPRPPKPFFEPVVIQQSNNFDRPSFALNPPPAIQANVAASAY